MIARTRTLQLKQFDSDLAGTDVRLTSPDQANSDTYVAFKMDGSDSTLQGLIAKRGKLFRVTIEEID